ncbi:MAG: class I SAM-dependent methyltransferase, partial [Oligoflexia bacterium]|nr:class I SAM-dependent methyltransferase [Oligoflexia bacterium]
MADYKKSYDTYKDKIEDLLYSKTDEKKIVTNILVNRYGKNRFENFLDVGAGTGTIAKIFYDKSDKATLVEILPEYKKSLYEQFPEATIIIDSIFNIDFKEKFDMVLLNQCLYYFKKA